MCLVNNPGQLQIRGVEEVISSSQLSNDVMRIVPGRKVASHMYLVKAVSLNPLETQVVDLQWLDLQLQRPTSSEEASVHLG